jgi:hypothetical protein
VEKYCRAGQGTDDNMAHAHCILDTKWQDQWTSSTKGAVSKLFFPNIKDRMKTRIPIPAEFTAIVTGHGLTRSYLHRFKFIPNPTCPCRIKE